MRRRSFAAAIAAGTLPMLLPRELLGLGRRLQPVGLQLYTVRDLMKADFEGTLAAVAKLGYKEVEFAGYFGRTPDQVKAALKAADLSAPSAHVTLPAGNSEWSGTCNTAAEMGLKYLVVPSVPKGERTTLADWQELAKRFNELGEAARKHGVRFAYHNHEYEFVMTGEHLPYDVLLEGTDRDLVKFEMDIFWIRRGGQDPVAYFKKWKGRFPMVHVKDMTREGKMVDVGDGVIDWKAIYAARKEAGIEHWFVEHDEPADPMGSLRASYKYMKDLN
jgi:sugar phosphate isomerase/epimerase